MTVIRSWSLAFRMGLGVFGIVSSALGQWQVANPTPGQTFTRLVVGGDGQVAGATVEGFGLMVSPTGTGNWRSQVLPKAIDGSATVQDLLWANGRWVAASPGYIHSSTDLANWTASEPLSTAPYALAWDGSKYWAFGYASRVAHSSDAVTWAQLPNNDLKIPQPAEAIWFNHRFVVVGQNTIASSADGSAWTTHVSASPYYVGDVESGGGRLIAVGSNLGGATTNFFRSADGTTWSPIAAPVSPGGYFGVTYGNGRWLALNYQGSIYASDNQGDSWQLVGGIPNGPTTFYRSLGYRSSDNRFFCGGIGGAIYSSTDGGVNWVNHREGFTGSVTMIAQGGGRFVGVGNAGGGPGSIYTSADGMRWSSNNTGFAENFVSVRYLNGAFLAYSVSPKSVVRSTDGIQFTQSVPGPSIRDILWDGSRYVGYANGTNLYASGDGVEWTQIPGARHPASQQTTVGVGSFAYLDGKYLIFAQGYGGQTRFFSSADLANWTTNIVNNVPSANYSDIVKSGNRYYVSAQQALFSSADGVTWTGRDYSMLGAAIPQPAGTSLIDRSGRLYTMQFLGANTYSGQRLIYTDDGETWTLATNTFPAPFLPYEKGRLLYTGTRLIAANFAGGLFAYYDIDLPAGSGGTGTPGFEAWIAGQGVPANQRGALDDPDQDGFPNGAEYALGTRPDSALPGDRPALLSGAAVEFGVSFPSVTFVRRKGAVGVSITVDGAEDVSFAPTSPTRALPAVDLGDGTERVTFRADRVAGEVQAFFFRLKVAAQ